MPYFIRTFEREYPESGIRDVSHLSLDNGFIFLFEVSGLGFSTGINHLVNVSEIVGVNPFGISSVRESVNLADDSLRTPVDLPGSHNWLQ